MAKFVITMTHRFEAEMDYEVEADSEEEAIERAEALASDLEVSVPDAHAEAGSNMSVEFYSAEEC